MKATMKATKVVALITILIISTTRVILGQNLYSSNNSICSSEFIQIIPDDRFGTKKSFQADIDGDGNIELLVSSFHYWYIVEFDESRQSYEVVWMSHSYVSKGSITYIDLIDIDLDNKFEIVVATGDNIIEFYDPLTKELKSSHELPNIFNLIFNFCLADADNDGELEFVLLITDRINLYKFQNGNFYLTKSFSIPDFNTSFMVGDVNNDGKNEIVFSNKVMLIENGEISLIWKFSNDFFAEGSVELEDIDNDDILEIIVVKFNSIFIYDADIQELKLIHQLEFGVDAYLFYDTDNNGSKEFIFGLNPKVYCINLLNGFEYWQVTVPDLGITNFLIADFDNDDSAELFVISNRNYVYSILDQSLEWTSTKINGPIMAIEVADLNSDNKYEIISLSYSGIITVFDAESNEKLWQSDHDFLTLDNSRGMRTMEIFDIDNDGTSEIIIASGLSEGPAIWVIDGSTFVVKSFHNWTNLSNTDPFICFDIADIDNNGTLEYVVASDNYIHVIDPLNYEMIWSLETFGPSISKLICGNIDQDPALEIITLHNGLKVYDGITKEPWQLNIANSGPNALFLYDIDGDAIDDILAGTSTGNIFVINGITHAYEQLPIYAGESISDIHVTNISSTNTPSITYTINDRIYFSNFDGTKTLESLLISNNSRSTAITKVTDFDNDGNKEIYAGTQHNLLKFDSNCLNCHAFDAEFVINDPDCNNVGGGILTIPVSGTEPYGWDWSNGSSSAGIYNLSAGIYTVTINDYFGCSLYNEIILSERKFVIDSLKVVGDNISTANCEGEITFFFSGGNPPYYFMSEGDTIFLQNDTIKNLCKGTYDITFFDSEGCNVNSIFSISGIMGLADEPILDFNLFPNPTNQFINLELLNSQINTMMVEIWSVQGILIKSIELRNSTNILDINYLDDGLYIFKIISNEKCFSAKVIKN